MSAIHLPSPAKLNLYLHIVGRMENGYHELQTLFQFIDYCDTLSFEKTSGAIELSANRAPLETSDNLILKAQRALMPFNSKGYGVKIHLNKQIPIGGGLGGGSSNCATTLIALNYLWDLGLDRNALIKIGAKLGADVPIFVLGQSAIAQGIGEHLTPSNPEQPYYLVVFPNFGCNTSALFASKDLTRDTPSLKIGALESGDIWNDFKNDFETVVRKTYPEIEKLINYLSRHSKARLSGSGSCVFAAFSNQAEAKAICQQLPKPWQGMVVKGLNQSPLHQALDRLEKN